MTLNCTQMQCRYNWRSIKVWCTERTASAYDCTSDQHHVSEKRHSYSNYDSLFLLEVLIIDFLWRFVTILLIYMIKLDIHENWITVNVTKDIKMFCSVKFINHLKYRNFLKENKVTYFLSNDLVFCHQKSIDNK